MIIGAYPTRHDLRFARTQREAGLHHVEWERLPRQRSWLELGCRLVAWGVFFSALLFLTVMDGWI